MKAAKLHRWMPLVAAAALAAGSWDGAMACKHAEQAKLRRTAPVRTISQVERTVTAPKPAALVRCPRSLSAEERRVVEWLVERILHLEPTDATSVDFTEQEVTAATGIDVAKLDPDRVRREVASRLRSRGLEAHPEARPVSTHGSTGTQAPATDCDAPGAASPDAMLPGEAVPHGNGLAP